METPLPPPPPPSGVLATTASSAASPPPPTTTTALSPTPTAASSGPTSAATTAVLPTLSSPSPRNYFYSPPPPKSPSPVSFSSRPAAVAVRKSRTSLLPPTLTAPYTTAPVVGSVSTPVSPALPSAGENPHLRALSGPASPRPPRSPSPLADPTFPGLPEMRSALPAELSLQQHNPHHHAGIPAISLPRSRSSQSIHSSTDHVLSRHSHLQPPASPLPPSSISTRHGTAVAGSMGSVRPGILPVSAPPPPLSARSRSAAAAAADSALPFFADDPYLASGMYKDRRLSSSSSRSANAALTERIRFSDTAH
ncbi:hypothetical protein HK405_005601 [Cladochytrium tenue]|nr:hypothetical protein HK405_005601 [Cladochytrium tenue]